MAIGLQSDRRCADIELLNRELKGYRQKHNPKYGFFTTIIYQ